MVLMYTVWRQFFDSSTFENAERLFAHDCTHSSDGFSRAGGSRVGPNGDMVSSHAAMTSPHWSYSELMLRRSLCEGFLAALRGLFVGHGWLCCRHACFVLAWGIA